VAADLPLDDLEHVAAAVGASWERLRGRRVFMTGATGFVGKWLLASLLHADRSKSLACRIAVLTRDPAAFAARAPSLATDPRVQLVTGDVKTFDADGLRFDVLVHGATDVARTPAPLATFDTCVAGTRRVLELAKAQRAEDVLFISSGAVYGRQPAHCLALPESHEGAPDPLDPRQGYGQGKRAAEWLCAALSEDAALRIRIARCFAFVGPFLPLDGPFAIGNFLRDALARRPLTVQGDGTPVRSYLHAADMAAWLWTILLAGRPGRAYNVGGREALSIGELARRVASLLEAPAGVRFLRAPRPDQVPERYVPDVTRASAELGLRELIGLDEAILRTAHWLGAQTT
jgi:dTDP-glucose 4,6-dehydratase